MSYGSRKEAIHALRTSCDDSRIPIRNPDQGLSDNGADLVSACYHCRCPISGVDLFMGEAGAPNKKTRRLHEGEGRFHVRRPMIPISHRYLSGSCAAGYIRHHLGERLVVAYHQCRGKGCEVRSHSYAPFYAMRLSDSRDSGGRVLRLRLRLPRARRRHLIRPASIKGARHEGCDGRLSLESLNPKNILA
jgi:hypothetical protein